MARLKVFTTQSGFYDLAVAAPSQAGALRAWGIRQNLFAEGMAKVASDDAIVKAALANPGVVLKRALGTKGAFSEDAPLPKVKGAKKKPKARVNAAARKAVVAAQAALDRGADAHERNVQELKTARAEIDAKLGAEEENWKARRATLTQKVDRAQRTLRSKN
jgi:flagellar motility protein MotE (MotC chaperone)